MICRIFGHRWSTWQPVADVYGIPSDTKARFCRRCYEMEFTG